MGSAWHKHPIIGITRPEEAFSGRGYLTRLALQWAVQQAGGRPWIFTPKRHLDAGRLDGLILSGGLDIYPERYGQTPSRGYPYDLHRDRLEAELFRQAHDLRLPILGICRGAQMINVCLGGSLYLDIKLIYEGAQVHDTIWRQLFCRKTIIVAPDSRLRALAGAAAARVNSLHHQSVDRLGEGLRTVAWEENGIVQAIEAPAYPNFLLGVQWHPEYLPHLPAQRRIFNALVTAAQG